LTVITLVLSGFVLSGSLYLILLHIYLRYKGLTTYEWIMIHRERRKAQHNRQVADETNNDASIANFAANNSVIGENGRSKPVSDIGHSMSEPEQDRTVELTNRTVYLLLQKLACFGRSTVPVQCNV
jgi:hypothetical protein